MKSISVRLLALVIILIAVGILYSCKKDKNEFVCDIAVSDLPAGDSAVLILPNAFSPNGDGLNDMLKPFCKNIQSVAWSVYDQDGDQVFSTTDANGIWNPGNIIGSGIALYHYKIKAVSNQGNTISKCGNLYVYICIPSSNPYNVGSFLFGDQVDLSNPDVYIPTAENFQPCQ